MYVVVVPGEVCTVDKSCELIVGCGDQLKVQEGQPFARSVAVSARHIVVSPEAVMDGEAFTFTIKTVVALLHPPESVKSVVAK